jgi:hypothetical protein
MFLLFLLFEVVTAEVLYFTYCENKVVTIRDVCLNLTGTNITLVTSTSSSDGAGFIVGLVCAALCVVFCMGYACNRKW